MLFSPVIKKLFNVNSLHFCFSFSKNQVSKILAEVYSLLSFLSRSFISSHLRVKIKTIIIGGRFSRGMRSKGELEEFSD